MMVAHRAPWIHYDHWTKELHLSIGILFQRTSMDTLKYSLWISLETYPPCDQFSDGALFNLTFNLLRNNGNLCSLTQADWLHLC
jgi:hypothetical protein